MLLQSLLRPVLTPIMRGIFDPAQSIAAAWSPLSLWPDGIDSPGMWISPRTLTSEWQDYTGTTPVVTPGTVADTSNPVGLALDIRAGATVLTDPGNHMLQSTSAARPLMSARVNLLTYTEDFSSATGAGTLLHSTTEPPPTGVTTSKKFIKTGSGFESIYWYGAAVGNVDLSVFAKQCEWKYLGLYDQNPDKFCYFDLDNGTVGDVSAGMDASIVSVGGGWYRCNVSFIEGSPSSPSIFATDVNGVYGPTGDGTSGIYIAGVQLQIGDTATPYQSVPGDGSTYATDFPIYQKYDGTDDGMATATFSAGTLTSAMDCMIPVRRDSAAACVAGLYNGIADATKFFGMAESASGSGCVGSGAGTPTVWVDGVQLSGGTAVTRGTLHTALTVGDWHILEFRGLDLSTWTAAGFGLYTSYVFPGARGDIMLYPSTDSTADKDAARQYLADYYGVTLP